MTNEERQILLKDLCARLPYGVKIHIDFNGNGHIVCDATLNTITSINGQFFNFTDFEQDFQNGDCCPISGFGSNKRLHLEEFKPYLRSMSRMTNKEALELGYCVMYGDVNLYTPTQIDCLNAHHFDYRGLIPLGLALEAPQGMYENR